MNEIAIKSTIAEIGGRRSKALALYAEAYEKIKEADKMASIAAPGFGGLSRNTYEYINYGDWSERVRQELDTAIWRYCIKATALSDLMDAQAKKQFEEQLGKTVPEASEDNISATMMQMVAAAPDTFKRGVVNAFRYLAEGYKSNDAFKIGKRGVRSYAVSYCTYMKGFTLSYRVKDELLDVDRVMHLLDRKTNPTYPGELVSAIQSAMAKKESMIAETTYFTAKWFKNGNIHLIWKRPDLMKQVNRIIAEHFGENLADAS